MSEYSGLDLATDATAFASSRFGQHYLARLEASRKRHIEIAMNTELNDSYRAHAATKAATVQSEIDYFTTSRNVLADPTLLERLKAAVRGRETPEPIV
ncbi:MULTISPECIES: hypothetical protein [unclassified Rathayibacter]|uniref:hypothetical protein n=1 Tax=unclassified Rathayibacter TaxID=2609250 RepID=UPI000CE84689|nr:MULTISPECIES: hypothetical protein [unclassified Rathayibacter]PPG91550.1 hypothetical protein C5C39_06875 [Rathayibacter sp. AY1F3]QHC73785.1 hypothetical protein GSU40_08915 [Rathayibacter sp. VKM Ac-2805]